MERRKNIARRSGENIAAAEVEAVLQSHPAVAQAAVLAVQDEVREEDVLICIVLKKSHAAPRGADDTLVHELLSYCNAQMSYFKVPGWLWFPDAIPITSTQNVQKHRIFAASTDPRSSAGMGETSNTVHYWSKATELRYALLVFALRLLGIWKIRTEQREITALSVPLVVAATKGVKPLVVFFGLQLRKVAHPV